jgi:quercetin dioxygenase-like cupin family protein
MRVITETTERTIETPTAVMAGLAAPSQGTAELSTWRVRMTPGGNSPVHTIDREQVWMPLRGTFEFTEAEAIVCMAAGGQATVPGSDARQPLPWAL